MDLDVEFLAPRGPLQTEILPLTRGLHLHLPAWRKLWQDVRGATLFMSPDLSAAWLETIAGNAVRAQAVLVRSGGELIGATTLMHATVWRGPAITPRIDYAPYDADLAPGIHRLFPVRQVATLVSWRAGAIRPTTLSHPDNREVVYQAIAARLCALQSTDQIVLPALIGPDADTWLKALTAVGLAPSIHRLDRSLMSLSRVRPFDMHLADQSRNFRRRIQRARQAADAAGLVVHVLAGNQRTMPELGRLGEVAAQSWKQYGLPDNGVVVPYSGAQEAFISHLLARTGSSIEPVLAIVETEGEPVSALLCLRHGEVLTGLLTFYSGRFPEASPGLIGLTHLLDWAAENQVRHLDLNATQEWLRYMTDKTSTLCNVVVFLPTLRGRLYAQIARARQASARDALTDNPTDQRPVT